MKKLFTLLLFLFITMIGYSQTTGSYWRVTKWTTPFRQALPDSTLVLVRDSVKTYMICHVGGVTGTQTMAYADSAGWVCAFPKDNALQTFILSGTSSPTIALSQTLSDFTLTGSGTTELSLSNDTIDIYTPNYKGSDTTWIITVDTIWYDCDTIHLDTVTICYPDPDDPSDIFCIFYNERDSLYNCSFYLNIDTTYIVNNYGLSPWLRDSILENVYLKHLDDYVAVGTASPTVKLDVNGDVRVQQGIYIHGGSGDANGDGILAPNDITLVRRYLRRLGTTNIGFTDYTDAQKAAMDVTGDGMISKADEQALYGMIATYGSVDIYTYPDSLKRLQGTVLYRLVSGATIIGSRHGLIGNIHGVSDEFDIEMNGSMRMTKNDAIYFGGIQTQEISGGNDTNTIALYKSAEDLLTVDKSFKIDSQLYIPNIDTTSNYDSLVGWSALDGKLYAVKNKDDSPSNERDSIYADYTGKIVGRASEWVRNDTIKIDTSGVHYDSLTWTHNEARGVTYLRNNSDSVGIGTTTPATKLDVNGDATVRDTLFAGKIYGNNWIEFDTTVTVTPSKGKLSWNRDDGTLDVGMGYDNVVQQVGLETFLRIKNQSGVQIDDGNLVMAVGALGASGVIKGAKAVSDGTIPPRYIIGVATMNIPDGEDGYITVFGVVRGLDTDGSIVGETWADGNVLYAHPTIVGGLTNIRPAAPYPVVVCGMVIRAANINGCIFVRLSHGESINSLSNVDTVGGFKNYSVLYYDSITKVWHDTTGVLTRTDSVLWQRNASRKAMWTKYPDSVGIGTVIPLKLLHVYGSELIKDTLYFSSANHYITEGPEGMGLETDELFLARWMQINGNKVGYPLLQGSNNVNVAYDSAFLFTEKANLVLGDQTEKNYRLWVNGKIAAPSLTAAATEDSIIAWKASTGEFIAIPTSAISGTDTLSAWKRIGDYTVLRTNTDSVGIGTQTPTTDFTIADNISYIPVVVDSAMIDDGIQASEMSRIMIYDDAHSSWGDWTYGGGAELDYGVEGQVITIFSVNTGKLYLRNNDVANDVVFEMCGGDNITLKYVDSAWIEVARTDLLPYNQCSSSGGGGIIMSVSGAWPITSTGGFNPIIGINQASATDSGYITSADWNTFNDKEPAITSSDTTKFWRGDKTWQTISIAAIQDSLNDRYRRKDTATVLLGQARATSTYVPKTLTVSTTSPLTGGGDLSTNRTLSIIPDTLTDWYTKMNQWKNDSANVIWWNDTVVKVATKYDVDTVGVWRRSVGHVVLKNNTDSVGVGTQTPTTDFTVAGNVNYEPKVLDSAAIDDGIKMSEMSRIIIYDDTHSAWYDWAGGSQLDYGKEGQLITLFSVSTGILYLRNNDTANTVVFDMHEGDNITIKYVDSTWVEVGRVDFQPYSSCVGSGGSSATYVAGYGITIATDTIKADTSEVATPYDLTLKQNVSDTSTKDATRYWVTQQGYTTNTGTVTSIATTSPLTGGTITTSGTIAIIPDTLKSWYTKMNQWKNDSANYLHRSDSISKLATRYWTNNTFRTMGNHDSLSKLDERSYNSLTDIPSTFAPSSHTHNQYRELSNHDSLSKLDERSYNSLTDIPSTFTPSTHTHGQYRELTNHDSLSKLDERSYNSLTDIPSTFAPSFHTQAISTITNLQVALDSAVHWSDTNTYIQTKIPGDVTSTLITESFSGWSVTCTTPPPTAGSITTHDGKQAYYLACGNGDHSGYIEKSVAGTWDSVSFYFDPTGVSTTIELQPYGGGTTIKSVTSSASGWLLFSSGAPITGGFRITFIQASNWALWLSTLTGYDHTNGHVILAGNVYMPGIDSTATGTTVLGINNATGKVIKVAAPSGATYTAGYRMALNGSIFGNTSYWGNQDSLNVSDGIVVATSKKLSSITNGSATWNTVTAKQDSVKNPWLYSGGKTIQRSPGAVRVSDSISGPNFKITPEGGYAVKMIAGEDLELGDIVMMGSADGTVSKTTSATHVPIGVVYANASTSASVWVVISGIATVKFFEYDAVRGTIAYSYPIGESIPYPETPNDKSIDVINGTLPTIGTYIESKSTSTESLVKIIVQPLPYLHGTP